MSSKQVSCEELVERLFVYLDRELDRQTRAQFDHHLEACRDCFSRVEFEQRLRDRIGATGTQAAPERLRRRVKALLDEF